MIGGIADRFDGLISTFAMSFIADRAFKILDAYEFEHLDEYFHIHKYFNWTAYDHQNLPFIIKCKESDDGICNFNAIKYPTKLVYFSTAAQAYDDILSLNRTMAGRIQTNIGKLNQIFSKDFIDSHTSIKRFIPPFTIKNAFSCLFDFLFIPKVELFSSFDSVINQMRTSHVLLDNENANIRVVLIGIQIRVGDYKSFSNKEGLIDIDNYNAFFDCATSIEENILSNRLSLPNMDVKSKLVVKWFLLSDSAKVRIAALKKFGEDKLISPVMNIAIEHSRSSNRTDNGYKTALAEYWLFGECDYFVITKKSGFGRQPAFRSLPEENSIYTIDLEVAPGIAAPAKCGANDFTPLHESATHWSGI